MNKVNSTIDLSLMPDATLHTAAKKIVSTLTDGDNRELRAFSLMDVTKAIANFHVAATNAHTGDATSLAIRNLAKEALISVLLAITDKETIHKKLEITLP